MREAVPAVELTPSGKEAIVETVFFEDIHIAGEVGDTGHTTAERPRKCGKTAAVVACIGSTVSTCTRITAAVMVHCTFARVFRGASRHIAHEDGLNEVVHFGVALAVCIDSAFIGIVNGMAGVKLEGRCAVIHECLEVIKPIGNFRSNFIADSAFFFCGEVMLTAEPEMELEAVAFERRSEEIRVDIAVFLASRPFFDQELAARTVAPFLVNRKVVAFFHPAGFQADGVARKTLLAELSRISHNFILVSGILIEERQTVSPLRKKRRTSCDVCKAFQKIGKAIARKEEEVYFAVGEIPNDLVCVLCANVNAMPPCGVTKNTVAGLCHHERNGHFIALIYDTLEISLAIQNKAVGIGCTETIEAFVFNTADSEIFGILLEVHRTVAALCIFTDDLLRRRTHTVQFCIEIFFDRIRFRSRKINRACYAVSFEGNDAVCIGYRKTVHSNTVFDIGTYVFVGLAQKIVAVKKRFRKRFACLNADNAVSISDKANFLAAEIKFFHHCLTFLSYFKVKAKCLLI